LRQTLDAVGPFSRQQAHADLATALGHAVAVEELTPQVRYDASVEQEAGVKLKQSNICYGVCSK